MKSARRLILLDKFSESKFAIICFWESFFLICLIIFAAPPSTSPVLIKGESLVLHGEATGNLLFQNIRMGTISIRSNFSANEPGSIVYKEGEDYLVDYKLGTVRRIKGSKIPDFSLSNTYGIKDFFHQKLPDTSNKPYFVWVDYEAPKGSFFAVSNYQKRFLMNSREKLEKGGAFNIATYGDSITAGGEASKKEFFFTQRYLAFLQREFPNSKIQMVDYSISGYSSFEGLAWFYKKPNNFSTPSLGAAEHLDLVIVGFGMNDHNIIDGVEPKQFESNLIEIARLVKKKYDADVIFFSAFPPNENWYYGTHRMQEYANATRMAAIKTDSAYVDVFGVWAKVLARKDQSSLLANDINHPNDFGHWLYGKAFEAMSF